MILVFSFVFSLFDTDGTKFKKFSIYVLLQVKKHKTGDFNDDIDLKKHLLKKKTPDFRF